MPVYCCVCDVAAETEEGLRVHITVRHVHYIPLECHHCQHVCLPTFNSLTKHYAEVHPSELPVATAIISYDAQKAAEVERLIADSKMNKQQIPAKPAPKTAILKTSQVEEASKTNQQPAQNFTIRIMKTEQHSANQNDHSSVGKNFAAEGETPETTDPRELANDEDCRKTVTTPESENIEEEGLNHTDQNSSNHMETIEDEKMDNCQVVEQSPESEETKDDDSCATVQLAIEKEEVIDEQEQSTNSSTAHNTSVTLLKTPREKRKQVESDKLQNHRRPLPMMSVDCALCDKTSFATADTRAKHIWREHMTMKRFGCRLCPQVRAGVFDGIQNHVSRYHPGEVNVIEDAKLELLQQYKATRLLAFPPEHQVPTCTPGYCRLCSKTVIAKPQHIWGHHMQMERFACGLCDYTSAYTGKMTVHMCTKHPQSADAYMDRKVELSEEYKRSTLLAFGAGTDDTAAMETANIAAVAPTRKRPGAGTPDTASKRQRLQSTCALCGKTSLYDWVAREKHLWLAHMPKDRFRCRFCPQMQTSRQDYMNIHVDRYHAGDVDVVVDAKLELKEQYQQIKRRAFAVVKK